jgi:hypothetical protein
MNSSSNCARFAGRHVRRRGLPTLNTSPSKVLAMSGTHPSRAFAFGALAAMSIVASDSVAARGMSRHALQPLSPRFVSAHNSERAVVGSPGVYWSPALALAARAYADRLAATGQWRHSPARERRGQGENLWMGTRGAFTIEQMIGSWASEKSMFRPGTFPNVSRTGSWHDVGHYTQMVWPESRAIGCAISSSARFDYLVCRYASPGNVMGREISTNNAAYQRPLPRQAMAATGSYPGATSWTAR